MEEITASIHAVRCEAFQGDLIYVNGVLRAENVPAYETEALLQQLGGEVQAKNHHIEKVYYSLTELRPVGEVTPGETVALWQHLRRLKRTSYAHLTNGAVMRVGLRSTTTSLWGA